MSKYNVILNKVSSARNAEGKVVASLLNLQFDYEDYYDAYASYLDKVASAAKHSSIICFTLIEETISLINQEGEVDCSLSLSNNVRI